jgi:hypothetical protein
MLAPDKDSGRLNIEPFRRRTRLYKKKGDISFCNSNIDPSHLYRRQLTEQDKLELSELGPGAGACWLTGGHGQGVRGSGKGGQGEGGKLSQRKKKGRIDEAVREKGFGQVMGVEDQR